MNNRQRPLSVLLAADHPAVLQGLVAFLRTCPEIKVVAECSDGIAALEGIQELTPDVAVLDMVMPGLTGLDVLSTIGRSAQETKFVLLTATASDRQIVTAIARGATGIVHKDAALEDLVRCIHEVAKGRKWLSTTIADKIAGYQSHSPALKHFEEQLTTREHEIMLLVSRGLSNKEIGRKLDVSEGTVKIHLHRIYQKGDVANRTVLTAMVLGHSDHNTRR